ncbi:hypothetical protein [Saccharibacillus alkalitolerans]|uniref:Peptidase C39-like domain-containing protein n=1 Tax=Saccharibacillus alkalitolerans TaxID=2705290 RepID=A0ABX0F8B3_9BACL|nr:hypothetical protein [Saccharibacillus alkalitolerans]NGZ77191.1 hypothetical protein [Saccharibacillus alkalitolerans]
MTILKKAAIGSILLTLAVSSNVTASHAQSLDLKTIQAEVESVTDVPNPVLTSEEILRIADMHINGYLKDDWQTKGLNLKPSPNQIPLYDLESNVIAYMIPLLSGDQEIGYISIGALRDSYDAYDIFIDDQVVQSIRDRLSPLSIASLDDPSSSKLVFVPPMTYMIQTNQGQEEQYLQLEDDFESVEDVTQAVTEQKDQLQQQYRELKTPKNEQRMQRVLEEGSNANSFMAAAAVTKEDYALTVEASQQRFVPVNVGSGTYSYGGDQGWWGDIAPKSPTKETRGCAPVAAANLTTYLAKITNPSVYRNLYSGVATSQNDFLAHMNVMYNYINPGLLGETSVYHFIDSVEKYAKDKNVNLKAVYDSTPFTLDNTANYAKAGLRINSPVATLNLSKFTDYEYEWHWMTITKYYRDVNDNRWIAVSTWGKRRSINYRTHFEAMTRFKSLGGGLVYFK